MKRSEGVSCVLNCDRPHLVDDSLRHILFKQLIDDEELGMLKALSLTHNSPSHALATSTAASGGRVCRMNS